MKLPHAERAYVPPDKLGGYLLSSTHPEGQYKARYFLALGYAPDAPGELEQSLLEIAKTAEVTEAMDSPYGTKYVLDGSMGAPNGAKVLLRTVWVLEHGEVRPRFVTAYPVH